MKKPPVGHLGFQVACALVCCIALGVAGTSTWNRLFPHGQFVIVLGTLWTVPVLLTLFMFLPSTVLLSLAAGILLSPSPPEAMQLAHDLFRTHFNADAKIAGALVTALVAVAAACLGTAAALGPGPGPDGINGPKVAQVATGAVACAITLAGATVTLTKVGGGEHPAGSAVFVAFASLFATYKSSKTIIYVAAVAVAHNLLEVIPRYIYAQQAVLFPKGTAPHAKLGYGLIILSEVLQVFAVVWKAWPWRTKELARDHDGNEAVALGASDRLGGYRGIAFFVLSLFTAVGVLEAGLASHGGGEPSVGLFRFALGCLWFFTLIALFSMLLDKAILKAVAGVVFLAGAPSAIHFVRLFKLVGPVLALKGVAPPYKALGGRDNYLSNGTCVALVGAIGVAVAFGPSPLKLRPARLSAKWAALSGPAKLQRGLALASLAVMALGCVLVWTDSKADGTTLEAIAHGAFFLACLQAVAAWWESPPLTHCTILLLVQSTVATVFTLDVLLSAPAKPGTRIVSQDDLIGHKVIIAGGAVGVCNLLWKGWRHAPDDDDDAPDFGAENSRQEYVSFE